MPSGTSLQPPSTALNLTDVSFPPTSFIRLQRPTSVPFIPCNIEHSSCKMHGEQPVLSNFSTTPVPLDSRQLLQLNGSQSVIANVVSWSEPAGSTSTTLQPADAPSSSSDSKELGHAIHNLTNSVTTSPVLPLHSSAVMSDSHDAETPASPVSSSPMPSPQHLPWLLAVAVPSLALCAFD
jgi:hypothetical protein